MLRDFSDLKERFVLRKVVKTALTVLATVAVVCVGVSLTATAVGAQREERIQASLKEDIAVLHEKSLAILEKNPTARNISVPGNILSWERQKPFFTICKNFISTSGNQCVVTHSLEVDDSVVPARHIQDMIPLFEEINHANYAIMVFNPNSTSGLVYFYDSRTDREFQVQL